MKPRAMRVELLPNPWMSVGFHVDHRAGFVDLHLPGLLVRMGAIPEAPEPHLVCRRCRGQGIEPKEAG